MPPATPGGDPTPAPEPPHTVVPKTDRQLPLSVHLVADYAAYEADTHPIRFAPTVMFQARTFSLQVRNTALVATDFRCEVLGPGEVPSGTSQEVATQPLDGP